MWVSRYRYRFVAIRSQSETWLNGILPYCTNVHQVVCIVIECIVEFYEWSVKVSHVLPTWEKSFSFLSFFLFALERKRTSSRTYRSNSGIGNKNKYRFEGSKIHFGRWIEIPRNEISLSRTIRALLKEHRILLNDSFYPTRGRDAASSFSDVCRLSANSFIRGRFLIRNSSDPRKPIPKPPLSSFFRK